MTRAQTAKLFDIGNYSAFLASVKAEDFGELNTTAHRTVFPVGFAPTPLDEDIAVFEAMNEFISLVNDLCLDVKVKGDREVSGPAGAPSAGGGTRPSMDTLPEPDETSPFYFIKCKTGKSLHFDGCSILAGKSGLKLEQHGWDQWVDNRCAKCGFDATKTPHSKAVVLAKGLASKAWYIDQLSKV